LSAQAGLVREISNDLKINIVDQFFLGGPLNLRGFEIRGCGPKDQGYYMGGNTYWATAFHFYSKLPFFPRNNTFSNFFRLHGFINGGNIYNMTTKSGKLYRNFVTSNHKI
jgi:outer membrane protein insertion porin family